MKIKDLSIVDLYTLYQFWASMEKAEMKSKNSELVEEIKSIIETELFDRSTDVDEISDAFSAFFNAEVKQTV